MNKYEIGRVPSYYLSGDMKPRELISVLEELRFAPDDAFVKLEIDEASRDWLLSALRTRV